MLLNQTQTLSTNDGSRAEVRNKSPAYNGLAVLSTVSPYQLSYQPFMAVTPSRVGFLSLRSSLRFLFASFRIYSTEEYARIQEGQTARVRIKELERQLAAKPYDEQRLATAERSLAATSLDYFASPYVAALRHCSFRLAVGTRGRTRTACYPPPHTACRQ